jgi:hypothetical protein
MLKRTVIRICLLLIFMLTASAASADENLSIIPAKDAKGKPPKVVVVEQPHGVMPFWNEAVNRPRTLVLISASIGCVPIEKDAFGNIMAEAGKDGWKPLLDPDYPAPRLYPVNASNYLTAAYLSGMIDRVVWVPPVKESLDSFSAETRKTSLKQVGMSDKDIDAIKLEGKVLKGSFNGIPLTIASLKDIPKTKKDVLLLIDLPFLTELYTDEIKTPILDEFGGFLSAYSNLRLPVSDVAISCSTVRGPVPLEMRFLAYYLRTYFTHPKQLKNGPPAAWDLRSQAMYTQNFFQNEDVLEFLKDAEKADPKDASIKFSLAYAYFTLKDLENFRTYLDKAATADKGYARAYIELSSYFVNQGMPEDAEYLLKQANKSEPSDPRPYELLHEIYFKEKDYTKAADMLTKLFAIGFRTQTNLATLADTYLKMGKPKDAINYFKESLALIPAMDLKSRAQLNLGLAEAYEKDLQPEKAVEAYQQATAGIDEEHARARVRERIDRLKKGLGPVAEPSMTPIGQQK